MDRCTSPTPTRPPGPDQPGPDQRSPRRRRAAAATRSSAPIPTLRLGPIPTSPPGHRPGRARWETTLWAIHRADRPVPKRPHPTVATPDHPPSRPPVPPPAARATTTGSASPAGSNPRPCPLPTPAAQAHRPAAACWGSMTGQPDSTARCRRLPPRTAAPASSARPGAPRRLPRAPTAGGRVRTRPSPRPPEPCRRHRVQAPLRCPGGPVRRRSRAGLPSHPTSPSVAARASQLRSVHGPLRVHPGPAAPGPAGVIAGGGGRTTWSGRRSSS